MYKIFVNCRYTLNTHPINMRNFFFLFAFLFLTACSDDDIDTLLPNTPVDVTVNLNLPQYIDLQTPTGWAYATGGIKGIVIQNQGVGSPPYKAFDRACPDNDCTGPMTFDGSLKLTCPCDNSTYSIIDGAPQTPNARYFAKEYKVTLLNSNTLHITNF